MRGILREGGLLAVTSRTWARAQEDGEEAVERHGRRARVTRTWHSDDPRVLEVSVTFGRRRDNPR